MISYHQSLSENSNMLLNQVSACRYFMTPCRCCDVTEMGYPWSSILEIYFIKSGVVPLLIVCIQELHITPWTSGMHSAVSNDYRSKVSRGICFIKMPQIFSIWARHIPCCRALSVEISYALSLQIHSHSHDLIRFLIWTGCENIHRYWWPLSCDSSSLSIALNIEHCEIISFI